MDKQLASKLLKITHPEILGALQEYTEFRINELKNRLATASLNDILGLQGAIAELKRFDTLRDEVKKAGEKNG